MEEAQKKLKQILDLTSKEDKEKLRKELAKMVPADENSIVTTKIGWGHYDDLVQTGLTFMVVPYKEDNENKDANYLFSRLIEYSDLSLKILSEGFDVILNKKPKKINLGFIPALEIAKKTKACSINLKIV